MHTTIQKWGNSQGIRLPKVILEMDNLSENDTVKIEVEDGKVIIIPTKKHICLKERIAEYEENYQPQEWDTGLLLEKRCKRWHIFQSREILF